MNQKLTLEDMKLTPIDVQIDYLKLISELFGHEHACVIWEKLDRVGRQPCVADEVFSDDFDVKTGDEK